MRQTQNRTAIKDRRDLNIQDTEGLLHPAAGYLSQAHVTVLVEHSEAVPLALVAVANVLSSEHESAPSAEEAEFESLGDTEGRCACIGHADVKLIMTGRTAVVDSTATLSTNRDHPSVRAEVRRR